MNALQRDLKRLVPMVEAAGAAVWRRIPTGKSCMFSPRLAG